MPNGSKTVRCHESGPMKNLHSDSFRQINWNAVICHALSSVSLDDSHLYAGDDRRRMARQHAARNGGVRRAGVLIPVVAGQQPQVVLTERSRFLRSHPGQISFPGGSVEPEDENVEAAALRESHEEVGLELGKVQVLGRLPDYITGTGFDIAPFVGWVDAEALLTPASDEVARVFSVPLQYVMRIENFRVETMAIGHSNYRFHVMEYEDNHIWGATAAMLFGLRECIARSGCSDEA